MAGINNNEDEFELYIRGHSIPEINKITGIALSTLRFRFSKAGILRSRGDGVRCAAKKWKLSSNKGVKRTFTPEWCMNISIAKKLSFKNTCAGVDVSKEYPRITKGAHKGKMIHRLVMEKFIGRELFSHEVVHHIDGDKSNNSIDNLALMTTSAHARLHRLQDQMIGKDRERTKQGRFK